MMAPLEPGIYFGLNEDRYHADPALGSSNLRAILKSPSDYWWNSWMNPTKPEPKDTKDAQRGTAAHVYMLQGKPAFDAAYVRRPDDPEGATPPEKGAITKEWNKKASAAGKTLIHGDDYDRIKIAATMIISDPEVAEAFIGGIPEVSVFFRREDAPDMPLKVRLDYLKPRAVTDLKSIKNLLKIDFEEYCLLMFARRNWAMQADLYLEGRRAMKALAAKGAVFGADYDKPLFKKIMESDEFAFGWVCYQADGAPLTWGKHVSPGNPILDIAHDQIEESIRRWRKNVQAYGTEMWVDRKPFDELDMSEVLKIAPWYGTR